MSGDRTRPAGPGPLAALAQLVGADAASQVDPGGEPDTGAWVVGGAIRDALLGRAHPDLDLAVSGDARALAAGLATATRGFRFSLSDSWGGWRVVAPDRSWRVDLTPLTAGTLADDLRRRDLTIDAIAQPLRAGIALGAGELIDPHDGLADLRARRLRAVGPESFSADPLRVMRLARLATELDFTIDPATGASARASATSLRDVAPERVFSELRQLICCARAVAGIESLRALGALAAVLPELEALRGVEQSDYHHLDVYEHTLATLQATIELAQDPGALFAELPGGLPATSSEGVVAALSQPLANELTHAQALRLGALLHDVAKARTRAVTETGRVTFFEHDVQGAALAAAILSRLRASERLAVHVAALTRHHLRLGFLVHETPLDARTRFRYLAGCEPVELDVTLLSAADRAATLGRSSGRAIALHLELARELVADALAWRQQRPAAPIRGDQLASALGLTPGPQLGRLLAELTEAAYAGEITGQRDVLAHARRWLASPAADG